MLSETRPSGMVSPPKAKRDIKVPFHSSTCTHSISPKKIVSKDSEHFEQTSTIVDLFLAPLSTIAETSVHAQKRSSTKPVTDRIKPVSCCGHVVAGGQVPAPLIRHFDASAGGWPR
ncbi:hypothetical protein EVAR_49087_1 [Eumeta japonica]|uniref:Uncharacterized protein n=1 Tax=Eumeta variegata TaxID=151549 RepID=A0A4C1Z4R9_EUMVA|nr:hypothetical protein EVAR_49087_1 [Eumeta japonica]